MYFSYQSVSTGQSCPKRERKRLWLGIWFDITAGTFFFLTRNSIINGTVLFLICLSKVALSQTAVHAVMYGIEEYMEPIKSELKKSGIFPSMGNPIHSLLIILYKEHWPVQIEWKWLRAAFPMDFRRQQNFRCHQKNQKLSCSLEVVFLTDVVYTSLASPLHAMRSWW